MYEKIAQIHHFLNNTECLSARQPDADSQHADDATDVHRNQLHLQGPSHPQAIARRN